MSASGTNYWASIGGSGVQTYVPGFGYLDSQHPMVLEQQAKLQKQTAAQAANFAKAQNQAEVAQVEQQAVEDEMEENRARNRGMTSMAFNQAQQGGRLGRGLFQRRQAGRKIGENLGALAKMNAGALKNARLNTLKATQGADLKRTNPVLGYQSALSQIYQQMS